MTFISFVASALRADWRPCVAGAAIAAVLLSQPAPAVAFTVPDPGGDETADLTLPPPGGQFFGFSQGPMTPGAASHTPKEYAAQAARVGANMLRNSLQWRRVEPKRDVWNETGWSEYKRIHDSLRARGITPLFTFGWAPGWAREADALGNPICTSKCPPADTEAMLAEWREFVAEAARRLPGSAFATWNEPNLAGPWGSNTIEVDPARYTRLAISSYEGIKAVAPGTPVIAGGLATRAVTEPSPDMDYRIFLDAAYQAGLVGKADGIDFHIYPQAGEMGAGTRFARIFSDLRWIKAHHGDETPLWVTEYGRTTSGAGGLSEADQADLLLRGVRRMLTMSDVRAVLIHRLDDNTDWPESHTEYGYGVLRQGTVPLPPKKAYCDLVAEAGTNYPLCPGALPPETTIDSAPPPVGSAADATFAFSTTEEWARLECSLDSAPFGQCSSPITYTDLADGEHRFQVRAVDAAATADPTPAEHTFRIENAPETVIDSGPAEFTANRSPVFTFSSSEPDSTFQCAIDGGTFQACSSGDSFGPLPDGFHSFAVRAGDSAGNFDPTPASRTFTIDTIPPETTITSSSLGRRRTATFSFTSDSTGARFQCQLDRGSWSGCASPYQTPRLGRGEHLFLVRAIDRAGNLDPTPAEQVFKIA